MPNFGDFEKPARKALTVFYVLDTSGSMTGTPISTLNSAMRETIEVLKNEAEGSADAQLRIAVLEFNSNVKWMNSNGAEDMEDFFYNDLSAGGLTYMGMALKELNDKLSKKKYLNAVAGNYMPVIIFMTDGYANDDWKKELENIRKNKWFQRAVKIGFAIGDDVDTQMITDVVGDKEAVIKTDDLNLFKTLIRFVSVTSSMLVSTSVVDGGDTTGAGVVDQAKKQG